MFSTSPAFTMVTHLLIHRRNQVLNLFNPIDPNSQVHYTSWMCRLIVAVIRSARKWSHKYQFPLTVDQQSNAKLLHKALKDGDPNDAVRTILHRFAFSLFGHTKSDYRDDKYFSPVNRFLVLASLHPKGHFRLASEITQIIAALTYNIRATMLHQCQVIMAVQKININQ